jgi:hypothetical protein
MNIHKSQLFWCELQGYYWFWHTATSRVDFRFCITFRKVFQLEMSTIGFNHGTWDDSQLGWFTALEKWLTILCFVSNTSQKKPWRNVLRCIESLHFRVPKNRHAILLTYNDLYIYMYMYTYNYIHICIHDIIILNTNIWGLPPYWIPVVGCFFF